MTQPHHEPSLGGSGGPRSRRSLLEAIGDYLQHVSESHRDRVQALLSDAAAEHARLIAQLSPDLQASLPVDAQGVTRAIDYLAGAAGLSDGERRALIRPHAVNPAVLHARVFGRAPLSRETVIGSFVEGARVRADALGALADAVGGEQLGRGVRSLLVANPPPLGADEEDVLPALRATYAAHERAAVMIAAGLDAA
jgi:hypothetical protein